MPISKIKIHPAIGIARLGNSPDEFFVGPEIPGDRAAPEGGYKDSSCRVKRQAARFRLFAYGENGQVIREITSADASITWTVHLANKKAAAEAFDSGGLRNSDITGAAREGLVIDPGPLSLSGPNGSATFDTGTFELQNSRSTTVQLGEIRTDSDGRLLVLGGFGVSNSPKNSPVSHFANNDGWHDDISDGPVTAVVTCRNSGETHSAEGSWVIVAPPKFAPSLDNVVTLYDTLFEFSVRQGWRIVPEEPSYTSDIYPILKRAGDIRAVTANFTPLGAHKWQHPVVDQSLKTMIFNKLKDPTGGGGNMPFLNLATLTPTQYEIMTRWRNGNFTNDWGVNAEVPASITPDGLDRAALENCVGAPLFPGIEGGSFLITDPSIYKEPFRLDHQEVQPGDVTSRMAVPWQADFRDCGNNWWPVPRPNSVILNGGNGTPVDWARGIGDRAEMIRYWHTLGFVVPVEGQYVEVDRCSKISINQITASLNFGDIPKGKMDLPNTTSLPIEFEIESPDDQVTLEIDSEPMHPRLSVYSEPSVTVGPTVDFEVASATFWITYETGDVDEQLSDSVSIRHSASDRQWVIGITASTAPSEKVAATLVVDRSSTMDEDRGDGEKKADSTKKAASIFVDVMHEGDGVALVGFNEDAEVIKPVTELGPATDQSDEGRTSVKDGISSDKLDPKGETSILKAVGVGKDTLKEAEDFKSKSIVVITDGKKNKDVNISEKEAELDEKTYTVGIGAAENTSASLLKNISRNHDGDLLTTGKIKSDNPFILEKQLLQSLADIINAQIVLVSDGKLTRGETHTFTFQLTEADSGMDVILLSDDPFDFDLTLKTPSNLVIDSQKADGDPKLQYVRSTGVSYYRVRLPIEYSENRFDQAGTWEARLKLREDDSSDDFAPRYSIMVQIYSGLVFKAFVEQNSFETGTVASLHSKLTEHSVPMKKGAIVTAEVTRPDLSVKNLDFKDGKAGDFSAEFEVPLSGNYMIRARAKGTSRLGFPFFRERNLSAVVWQGGKADAEREKGVGEYLSQLKVDEKTLAGLIECLVKGEAFTDKFYRKLKTVGIDDDVLFECVKRFTDLHDISKPKKKNQRKGK